MTQVCLSADDTEFSPFIVKLYPSFFQFCIGNLILYHVIQRRAVSLYLIRI